MGFFFALLAFGVILVGHENYVGFRTRQVLDKPMPGYSVDSTTSTINKENYND